MGTSATSRTDSPSFSSNSTPKNIRVQTLLHQVDPLVFIELFFMLMPKSSGSRKLLPDIVDIFVIVFKVLLIRENYSV